MHTSIFKNISSETNCECCLICWLPEEENNQINKLSEYTYIIKICKCDPKIHVECINKWVNLCQTCPICRTKLQVTVPMSKTGLMCTCLYKFFVSSIAKVISRIFRFLIFANCTLIIVHSLFLIYALLKYHNSF